MNSKNLLISENQSSPAEDSGQTVTHDEGEIKKNPDARVPGHDTQIDKVETRIGHAVARPIQSGALPRGTETVLVVENESSVRHLACTGLEAQGYNVLQANNGEEGLRVARDLKGQSIRLVITDVIMPLMGGKIMTELLKKTYPDLKILFTSGYTDALVTDHGMLEAGVEFLPKPYTFATLARKVREMLDTPQI
jgi:CheY-like chemotaxis protein